MFPFFSNFHLFRNFDPSLFEKTPAQQANAAIPQNCVLMGPTEGKVGQEMKLKVIAKNNRASQLICGGDLVQGMLKKKKKNQPRPSMTLVRSNFFV